MIAKRAIEKGITEVVFEEVDTYITVEFKF